MPYDKEYDVENSQDVNNCILWKRTKPIYDLLSFFVCKSYLSVI